MMKDLLQESNFLKNTITRIIHPGFSIDCVIISYYNKKLHVLLNKLEYAERWMLPGGFLNEDEDVDEAANRILRTRTAAKNAFLRQYHLFGAKNRTDVEENKKILDSYGLPSHNATKRFVSIGYYSLVRFEDVKISKKKEDLCEWFELSKVPLLYGDHNLLIDKALFTIRKGLGKIPLGYNLLDDKFVITELRKVYESIIGEKIDRRNFLKKMMSSGLIEKLDEVVEESNSFNKPFLYAFNKKLIEEMLVG